MGSSTTYVTLATQLNRAFDKPVLAGGTGAPLGEPIKRGQEFTAADVTDAELDRWLTLKPPVVISKKDLEDNAKTAAQSRDEIAELQEKVRQLEAQITSTGPAEVPVGLPEPGPTKSKAEWLAYATDKAKRAAGGEIPAEELAFLGSSDTTRDELAKRYGTAGR